MSHGLTEEVGRSTVVDPASPSDVDATTRHVLGLDRERLTKNTHRGRPIRLAGVTGSSTWPILA